MRKIAIIGSGISGLACAYFLRRRFETTLYEQNDYCGGHTHTVRIRETEREVPIDTGFMVYNEVTYPQLTRFFKTLSIATQPTAMSFSVQIPEKNLEYCGSSVAHLFAQKRNLFNPRFLRMLRQIHRFNSEAVAALETPRYQAMTLRQYAQEKGYGADFLDDYLIPMSSAVWSTPRDKMLEFPAVTLLRFFHNHGFLGLHTQHPWRTVSGGAESYVAKILGLLPNAPRLNQQVLRLTRHGAGVRVQTVRGAEDYDGAIFACHADEAWALLETPSALEAQTLGAFAYERNEVLLHSDASVMPRTKKAWASWNVRRDAGYSTHYWMNSLQGVSQSENYFVSLNAENLVDPKKVLRSFVYHHPLYTLNAMEMQKRLPQLNRQNANQPVYFCGSYFGYGFHEDAFVSALRVAEILLGGDPWS